MPPKTKLEQEEVTIYYLIQLYPCVGYNEEYPTTYEDPWQIQTVTQPSTTNTNILAG